MEPDRCRKRRSRVDPVKSDNNLVNLDSLVPNDDCGIPSKTKPKKVKDKLRDLDVFMSSEEREEFHMGSEQRIEKRLTHPRKKKIEPRLPHPRKKKIEPENAKKTYNMSCILIILVIGIIVSLLITLGWDSCLELPQLNGEYVVEALTSIVIDQEVAIPIVALALQTQITKLKTGIYKPLILSFHGSSGVGKTFLSSQISHFLPANTKVHKFHPSIHLTQGKTADFYEAVIYIWVNKHFNPCIWNIIVVEDVQDVTTDVQKAFKEVFSNMKESWYYRKLIVIFVSNLYSSEINDVVFNKVKHPGQNTFYKSDFEAIFERGPSNWLREMYQEGLLDAFVPFLPLNKNSVLKCIEQELKRYNKIPYNEIVNEISNDIVFYTLEGKGFQYSISGCKKVADKVALWINTP